MKKDGMGRACDTYGKEENAYTALIRSPKGTTAGIHRCRWEDNIKVRCKETGCDGKDCINLV
jgi:hypothetical protein